MICRRRFGDAIARVDVWRAPGLAFAAPKVVAFAVPPAQRRPFATTPASSAQARERPNP